MSNAVRIGRRTLAGVAAGALTAGLIPFGIVAAATTASAATTLSVEQSVSRAGVTLDDTTATINNSEAAAPAMRVYVQPSADVTGLTSGTSTVNVRIDSKPTGAGVAVGTVYKSATITGTVLADDSIAAVDLAGADNAATLAAFNVAGTYGVTVWVSVGGGNTVQAGEVTYLGSVTFAGAPTGIAFAETAQTGPANVDKANAVALTDASGNVTRLANTESLPITTAQTTGADDTLFIGLTANPSNPALTIGTSAATAATTATGSSYGIVVKASSGAAGTFTSTASGAGIGIATTATSVFTVEDQTTVKSLDISAAQIATTWEGPITTGTRTVEVASNTTRVTYTVTADDTAPVGDLVPITVTPSGVTTATYAGDALTVGSANTLYVAIDANRQAIVAIDVTGPSASSQVIGQVTIASSVSITADWAAPVFALTTTPPTGSSVVLAPGAAASVTAVVADQFGTGYLGAVVAGSNGTDSVTAVTPASGEVTLSIPAPATGTSATLTVNAATQGGSAIGSTSTITATYGTPTITLAGVSTTTVDETVAVPSLASNTYKTVTATVTVGGSNVPDGTIVSLDGSNGILFAASASGTVATSEPTATATTTSGVATFYVTGTQIGTLTVNASVAGVTASGNLTVQAAADSGRVLALTAPDRGTSGAFLPVEISTTDGFGNAVGNVTVSLGIPVSSIGRFANGLRTLQVTTDSAGQAVVDVTTGTNESGVLAVTATVSGQQFGNDANVPAGTNFAAGVAGDSVAIEIGSAVVPSIIIFGDRDGRVIQVVGETQGIAEGTVVRPWIRFPGQTSYTQGVAQRTVTIIDSAQEIGEFAWQRKTGKRTAVYFRTEDGSVQSSRIIIPAR